MFSFSNSFYAGEVPAQAPIQKRSLLDLREALDTVIDTFSLPIETDSVVTVASQGVESQLITGTTGAKEDPKLKLVYFIKRDGDLALTWSVETRLEEQYLLSYVDAETDSGVLGMIDFVSFATYEV